MKKFLVSVVLGITVLSMCVYGYSDKNAITNVKGVAESQALDGNYISASAPKAQAEKSQEIKKEITSNVKYIKSERVKNEKLGNAIVKELGLSQDEAKATRYYYNYVDLNDDGDLEVFVQLVGSYTSGSGGDTGFIFEQKNNDFQLFQEFTLIRNPIIISDEKTNGWHDIIMETYGGGVKAHYIKMKFDGEKYPSVTEAEELNTNVKIEGRSIINNEVGEGFENRGNLESEIIKVLKLSKDEAKATKYYYHYVDLNDDKTPEVFVHLVGKYTSGTGGDTGFIFEQKDSGFKLLQKFTLIRNPIIISAEKTNGWHDIIMETYGGGVKAHYVEMKFDGEKYPTISDAVDLNINSKIEGRVIINNGIGENFQDWEKLENAIVKELNLSKAEAKETKYYYNYVDLNGDENPEIFVQLVGRYTSGTGGDTGLVFEQKDNNLKLFQKFTLVRNPIIISNQKTNGWNDIIMETYGGGVKAHYVQMKFDGKKYPNVNEAKELNTNFKIEGKGIINNDIGEDIKNGKALYLK